MYMYMYIHVTCFRTATCTWEYVAIRNPILTTFKGNWAIDAKAFYGHRDRMICENYAIIILW